MRLRHLLAALLTVLTLAPVTTPVAALNGELRSFLMTIPNSTLR